MLMIPTSNLAPIILLAPVLTRTFKSIKLFPFHKDGAQNDEKKTVLVPVEPTSGTTEKGHQKKPVQQDPKTVEDKYNFIFEQMNNRQE